MHLFHRISLYLFAAIICSQSLIAQPQKTDTASTKDTTKKSEAKWDVTAKHGPSTDIEFDTDEGTWISVDVSPDGKRIVFDLLGDLYIVPINGGIATLLAGGLAYESQPRFSPDGKKISFTSDRDGCDNIWIMDPDGKNPKQITKEKDRQTNNAVWSPDGKYIVARKHYRNTRSLGAGEMWLYHIGGGDGLQLTKRRNWEQDAGEPCVQQRSVWSHLCHPAARYADGKNEPIHQRSRRVSASTSLSRRKNNRLRPPCSPEDRLVLV
ncbi:MAG: PD40 domain-containing protein [Ignavibacteriales bacterium]|nr:PD40 domain-containing protein [Ignavibacteriales bacterium]